MHIVSLLILKVNIEFRKHSRSLLNKEEEKNYFNKINAIKLIPPPYVRALLSLSSH